MSEALIEQTKAQAEMAKALAGGLGSLALAVAGYYSPNDLPGAATPLELDGPLVNAVSSDDYATPGEDETYGKILAGVFGTTAGRGFRISQRSRRIGPRPSD